MMPDIQPEFSENSLSFEAYPFRFGALEHSSTLMYSELRSVRLGSAPPALILRQGEIIFIGAQVRDPLTAWAERHGLGKIDLPDSWSLLCEPFVDTQYTPAQARRDSERLGLLGFAEDEIAAIRSRVAPFMLAYNATLWDWANLGHYDLLLAYAAHGPGLDRDFYDWSMRIALRGWGDKL